MVHRERRVVIGTTAPSTTLSLGNVSSNLKLALYDGGTSNLYGIGANAGNLTFVAGGTSSATPQMVLSSTGNVGIGTASPFGILDASSSTARLRWIDETSVSGSQLNIRANAGKNGFLSFTEDSVADRWVFKSLTGDSNLYLATGSPVSSSNKLTFTNSGNVGIGTTSPSYTLHVNGSVAGNGAYIALSDIRFKKDVQDLVGSLAKVLAIRGVSYKWTDEEKNGSGTQYGVIAQEIEKILPDVVVTGSDGIKRVKYDDLIPLIIEALKAEKASKDAEIAQLKAESAQLKARADKADAEATQLKLRADQADAESAQLKSESAQLKASLCGKFPDLPVCSN